MGVGAPAKPHAGEGRHHRGEAKLVKMINFNTKRGTIGVGAPAKPHAGERRHHRGKGLEEEGGQEEGRKETPKNTYNHSNRVRE